MNENIEELAKEHKIIVRDLMKVYRRGLEEVIALRGMDFEVGTGEFLSIVGPSGSGKTTLLRLIGALDRPTGGAVYFDGFNITHLNDYQAMIYRRSKCGFVWQIGNLVPGLTALQNVKLPMRLARAPKKASDKRARALLENMGLADRMNHKPHQLSGGEIQRVAICVALANNPEVLLADEITGELDSETASMVMDELRRINKEFKTTVINVTHNPRVAKYADRVLRIRDGLIEGQKHTIYGEISEVDAKGRIVIPESVRKLAGIKKRVILKVTDEGLLIRPLVADEEEQTASAAAELE